MLVPTEAQWSDNNCDYYGGSRKFKSEYSLTPHPTQYGS